jgi:aspartyl-tRNA(Asn)/glutamyl-tRNA(Gln) amidotransferase subunit C
MPLTADEFDRISVLARLRLTPEERRALPKQFQEIVRFVEQLKGFETDFGEEEQGVPWSGLEAEDVPGPCLPRPRVLANAPLRGRGLAIVGEAGDRDTGERESGDAEGLTGFFVVPEIR